MAGFRTFISETSQLVDGLEMVGERESIMIPFWPEQLVSRNANN